jgi:RNA polymerase sigma-70 factor (ECF subfamily)
MDALTPLDATATLRPGAASSFDTEDLVLSRALAAGEAEAFRVLVERETPKVFRTCYRILGRIDEAEDATQETFVLAFRALHTFRGDGPVGAWVARIATRESWRRASQGARRRSLTTPLDASVMDVPTLERGPLDQTLDAEERERVRLAVAALKDPYREIVTMRFFGELSIAEISRALRRPEGTVKAQLHRGLRRLRESMGRSRR